MRVIYLRQRLAQRFTAALLLVLFTVSGMAPAGAEIAIGGGTQPGGSSPAPGGIVWKTCKPPPTMCLSKEGKAKYAAENNCKFLEDVCKGTVPIDDSKGATGDDSSLFGDMWNGIKGGLVYGYEFVKGLMIGLKDQVMDLVHMVTNIDEVVMGLIDLGKAFFNDPKATLAKLADLLGQEAIDTITQATQCGAYDLGHVVGTYVSPAFALKLASRLTKYAGKLEEAAKVLKHEYGCASFGAGTLIMTPQGAVSIENIRVGQMVLSRNETSFADHAQPVRELFGRTAPSYRLLVTETATFKLTDEHPLWVQGKGWTEVSKVVEDDVISGELGDTLVRSNEAVKQPLRVYNFAVANTTNYFVGEGTLWAHNAACNIGIKSMNIKKLKPLERGFRGEFEVWEELVKKNGFKKIGETMDPNLGTAEAAYAKWVGKKGIDGIFEKDGKYYIVESKATGGTSMADPVGCVAKLCTMVTGERQMSDDWIKARLEQMVPDPTQREAILKGLKNGNTKRLYAQTDAGGTVFNEIDWVTDANVKIGKKWP